MPDAKDKANEENPSGLTLGQKITATFLSVTGTALVLVSTFLPILKVKGHKYLQLPPTDRGR